MEFLLRLICSFIVLMPMAPLLSFAEERPNVILVMSDDMGYECLTLNGGAPFETPHLDRLATEGVRFTSAYSNAMCTPTRVKIMSGKLNARNYEYFAYMNPNIYTIGNLMRDAGYQTAIVGKWQLNGIGKFKMAREDCWPRMDKNGFDEFCLWQGKLNSTASPCRYHEPIIEENGVILSSKDELKGRYGPDVLMDFACQYISRRDKERPFFIYYPMMLPHSPFLPTPDSEDPNSENRDQNFYDMVKYTDKLMGRLIVHLEKEGVLDNTLFLFTGDNGTVRYIKRELDGRRLKTGKTSLTDDGTRAILIAYWKKGMKGGQVRDDLVCFSDFMPTLADAAGIKPPADIDGVSFLPQIKGEKGNPRKWIVAEHDAGLALGHGKTGRWVRNHDYKLYQAAPNSLKGLYNTKLDPQEKNDLTNSTDPSITAVKKELSAVLKTLPPWSPVPPKQNAKKQAKKNKKTNS